MLNKLVMIDVFNNLLAQSKKSYDEFNAADGKVGDGDLGITILNGLEEINNNIEKWIKLNAGRYSSFTVSIVDQNMEDIQILDSNILINFIKK